MVIDATSLTAALRSEDENRLGFWGANGLPTITRGENCKVCNGFAGLNHYERKYTGSGWASKSSVRTLKTLYICGDVDSDILSRWDNFSC